MRTITVDVDIDLDDLTNDEIKELAEDRGFIVINKADLASNKPSELLAQNLNEWQKWLLLEDAFDKYTYVQLKKIFSEILPKWMRNNL